MQTVLRITLSLLFLVFAVEFASCVTQWMPTDANRTRETRKIMESFRNRKPFLNENPVDAWGNHLTIVVADDFTDIRSAGPDGLLLTDDDILLDLPGNDSSSDY